MNSDCKFHQDSGVPTYLMCVELLPHLFQSSDEPFMNWRCLLYPDRFQRGNIIRLPDLECISEVRRHFGAAIIEERLQACEIGNQSLLHGEHPCQPLLDAFLEVCLVHLDVVHGADVDVGCILGVECQLRGGWGGTTGRRRCHGDNDARIRVWG